MFVFSNLFRVMEIYENLYQTQYLRIISACALKRCIAVACRYLCSVRQGEALQNQNKSLHGENFSVWCGSIFLTSSECNMCGTTRLERCNAIKWQHFIVTISPALIFNVLLLSNVGISHKIFMSAQPFLETFSLYAQSVFFSFTVWRWI